MDTIETTEITTQVRRVLQQLFPSAHIEVEQADGAEKVSGYIVWGGFEGQGIAERQSALYQRLSDTLGEQARQVSLVFTYTPGEFAHMNSI